LGHSTSNKETNFEKIDGAVEALGEIAGQLGKKDLNFSVDHCINDANSSRKTPQNNARPYEIIVDCNCSRPGGVCHVENM
jgi:hypothetical protein